MKDEKLMFQIDQLRKDKIIYAVESCAVSLVVVTMLFSGVFSLIGSPFPVYAPFVLVPIALGYAIFMGIGNFIRLKKIKELEKKLK